MAKLTANEKCLIRVAVDIADLRYPEQISEYDTMEDYYADQLDRGHTFDIVLGGEGPGWWTRVEHFRVSEAEKPLVREMIRLIEEDPKVLWGTAALLRTARANIEAAGTTRGVTS